MWHNGYGPAVATDFINRYREDVALMKASGLTHYRTSINWSRFLLDYETAEVDEDYARYYDALLDECAPTISNRCCVWSITSCRRRCWKSMAAGVRPWWLICSCATRKVFARYAGKVRRWFVFNEPIVVQTRVYLDALRWPYHQSTSTRMQWNHHKIWRPRASSGYSAIAAMRAASARF